MEIYNNTKKPLVAVFGSQSDNKRMQVIRTNYLTSISAAGGIPFLVPMFASKEDYRQIAETADGFFFAGGVDIRPSFYKEETLPECGEIDDDRDHSEFSALEEIKKTEKPMFGVCRGIQVLNVFGGGTLWQDIPAQCNGNIFHSQKESVNERTHEVIINKDSMLYDIVKKDRISVNSFHHQAVKDTPFTVSARAEDGIIEAIEDQSNRFFLGVQWHPEHTFDVDDESKKLFSAFVSAIKN